MKFVNTCPHAKMPITHNLPFKWTCIYMKHLYRFILCCNLYPNMYSGMNKWLVLMIVLFYCWSHIYLFVFILFCSFSLGYLFCFDVDRFLNFIRLTFRRHFYQSNKIEEINETIYPKTFFFGVSENQMMANNGKMRSKRSTESFWVDFSA